MTTEQGKILTIKPEFLSQILVGDKNWEIRKSNSHHRGPVIFAASGTGKVWGVAMMENAIWKSSQDLQTQDAFQCHQLSSQQLEEYGGALGAYAWVFRNPGVFQDAVTFKPKRGAIVWHQMTQDMVNSVAAARRMPNPDRTTLLNAMETAVASAKMEEKEPSVLKSGHAQSASRTRCKRKVDDNVSYEPRPTLVVDPWGEHSYDPWSGAAASVSNDHDASTQACDDDDPWLSDQQPKAKFRRASLDAGAQLLAEREE